MEVFILRTLLTIFLMTLSLKVNAIVVQVECTEGFSCGSTSMKIKKSLELKSSLSEIRESIRFLLLDESINDMEIEYREGSVEIVFSQRPIIKNVSLTGILQLDENVVRKVLAFSEGEYFSSNKLEKSVDRLTSYYSDRGFDDILITPNILKTGEGVDLSFNIDAGDFVTVNEIKISSEGLFISKYVRSKLLKFKSKPWNIVNIKIELDSLTRELFTRGYFFSSINFKKLKVINRKSDLYVSVKLGLRYNFDFRGNDSIPRADLLKDIKSFLVNNFENVTAELIGAAIVKSYTEKGIYKTKVEFREEDGVNKSGDSFRNIYFKIREGARISVRTISFSGTNSMAEKAVRAFFYKNASTLVSRDLLDEKYIEAFPALLKKYYLEKGFLFVEVNKPIITFSPRRDFCNIIYRITERQQSILTEVLLPNVDSDLAKTIIEKISNKAGKPLNIIGLDEDLSLALGEARNAGYLFSTLKSTDPEDLILHSNNYRNSKFVIELNLGKKAQLESTLVTGYRLTKVKVIKREVQLKENEVITPLKIQKIKERIVGLGLFSKVKITPFVTNRDSSEGVYFVNLLIQVAEKNFGSGEIAPGYRTDIGYKASAKVVYSNLAGLNHSISLKTQINLRDNLDSLDLRRKDENRNLLEYFARVNYIWPYAFPSRFESLHNIEVSTSASIEQRRLFSFDADIRRTSLTLNKKINDIFSTSLKYQFENIRQFDSSLAKDNATFTIGSIAPSINIDLRDNPVNPSKGAFFGLSLEFANDLFGSLSEDNVEINFWKLISRNKFYYTLSDNWVLAFSISGGLQKNLVKGLVSNGSGELVYNQDGQAQTKGFIPSIEVFRLDGPDAVRGFSTSEINRLPTGIDISGVRIQNKAFFTTIKLEPRYMINDAMALGPFLDAGNVFVDNYKPLKLRSSAGISLKFITQVGTLDFDYGMKLKRRRLLDGGREGFGRFHLSIGFF